MNKLQTFITRLFGLEKPVDKKVLWAGIALISLGGFVIFSSLNDGSSSSSISLAASKQSSVKDQESTPSADSSLQLQVNAAKIYVHIVGFVVHPGLYALKAGDRVSDAIFAADGFSKKADQASVNLARQLSDGEQIIVLAKAFGDKSFSGSAVGDASASGYSNPGGATLINLNHATESELETLPGVGPTLAGRMIDWRLANGGFKTKSDLQKVAGIGSKLFDRLKDLVSL